MTEIDVEDWSEFFGPDEIEKLELLDAGLIDLDRDLAPDHTARSHVSHGASVAERFWNCPGSINLSKGRSSKSNSAAELGTAAHELCEICLRSGTEAYEHLGEIVNGIEINDTICEGVQVYLDVVRKYMATGWQYFIEERISLEVLNPPVPMAGTADFVAYNPYLKKMVCIDYKNGKMPVEIKNNKQVRYYGLGAYYSLPAGAVVEEIELIIVQPNGLYGSPVKRDSISFFDLIDWGFELVEKARETLNPNAAINPGDWCKYCPAKGVCPIRAERRLSDAQIAFSDIVEHPVVTTLSTCVPDLPVLTMEQRARIFLATPLIKRFLADIEESLLQDWQLGQEPPGLKMVESEGTRAWAKGLGEENIKEFLKTLPIEEAKYYTKPKLASPTQISAAYWAHRKTQGAKKKDADEEFKALAKDFIVRPKGQKLSASTDEREAVSVDSFDALEPLPTTD